MSKKLEVIKIGDSIDNQSLVDKINEIVSHLNEETKYAEELLGLWGEFWSD